MLDNIVTIGYIIHMDTTRTNNLQHALAYARAGYRVLPVSGKVPLVPHGAHDATTDELTIRCWWLRWPDASIAITLGGLVVIDVDPRNGGTVDALPATPATCTAKTGGGGLHFLFSAAVGARYPGRFVDGIDIKSGAGAYVVVAPSIHASGNAYEWITSPLDNAPAPAPSWLARGAAPAARDCSNARPATTPAGRRVAAELPGWTIHSKRHQTKVYTL